MNEEHEMDDATKIVNEGNGHTRRVPEWGDVEFVPTRPRRRSSRLWEAIMATKPVRNIAEYAQADRRPVPTWIPGAIITISILLLTQFGMFAYWRGGADRDLAKVHKIEELEKDNIRLNTKVDTLIRQRAELSQYVDQLLVYENDVRTRLISTGRAKPVELPPLPVRRRDGD